MMETKTPQIQLTPAACARIRDYAQANGAYGMRLGLRRAGCSGYAYQIELTDKAGPGDCLIEQDGARVVLAGEHLAALDGITIDFVREGLNHRFQIDNPNVRASCGCGESIAV